MKRNTQIYDLWKAAVRIRELLAQHYLTTVHRCTFAYKISLAGIAASEQKNYIIGIKTKLKREIRGI